MERFCVSVCFFSVERQKKSKGGKQNEKYLQQRRRIREELLSLCPSVSKRKTVGGKSYYVRRYFRGGKDFERTMERLAVNQANKAAR